MKITKLRYGVGKYCSMRAYDLAHNKTLCPSGYTKGQGYYALTQCWRGFKASIKENNLPLVRYYAAGIQRIQKDLGMLPRSFPELAMHRYGEEYAEQLSSDEIHGDEPQFD